MRRITLIIAVCATLLLQLGLTAPDSGQAYAADEERIYKLKAAFLLNFAKFTTWPETDSKKTEFTLCILGKNPFGSAFIGIEGKSIASKPIKIIQTEDIGLASRCNLVYISDSENNRLGNILHGLTQYPALLVSDIENFAENGGTIELTTVNDRLGFIINHTQAQKAGLKINASLLDLASTIL